ncbi:MAG: hypothetical protein D4R68_09125 [Ignavibacteriales bacterium]|nr:MAG: hypothetical protein D4R68_09125 [Ignavibacteriales bacterium]
MKSGQLFWGFFLLALGALFLLTKYDVLQSSFDFVYSIWPMIFVFWGALVIFKNSLAKPVISALFGIFLALLIFGFVENAFNSFDFSEHDGKYTEYYNEDYESAITNADLEINSGAGTFILGETTDKLVEGKTKGNLAEYDFETWKDDDKTNVRFNLHKRNFNLFGGRFKNYLKINLNENPIWDIRLNYGASKANLDLTKFKIRNLELHSGATSTYVKLGDKTETTNVNVEMGAANITIDVPTNVGCEIQSDMALSSKNIHGFNSKGKGHYTTENFSDSGKRIIIDIKAGVSSLTINRY